jgi:hypothetical protein
LIEVGVHNDSAIALTYGTGHHAAPGIYRHDKRWGVFGRDDKGQARRGPIAASSLKASLIVVPDRNTLSIFENATAASLAPAPISKSKMTPDSLDYPKVVSRENRASERRRIEFKKAADKKTVN